MQGTKVHLNVYDLSPANDVLYTLGMGLHHSGVEIMGSEFSFASEAGVFTATPKEAPGARFRESIFLGTFEGGQAQLNKALDDVKQDFGPDDYNLVRKNCNHFANALVWRLLGRAIPPHINRLADIGVCCSCLLPKQMLEQAPVGDPSNSNNNNGRNTSFGSVVSNRKVAPTVMAFAGKGARLGGMEDSTINIGFAGRLVRTSSPRQEDLVDRRDKARKAAMARLERNQQQQQQAQAKESNNNNSS